MRLYVYIKYMHVCVLRAHRPRKANGEARHPTCLFVLFLCVFLLLLLLLLSFHNRFVILQLKYIYIKDIPAHGIQLLFEILYTTFWGTIIIILQSCTHEGIWRSRTPYIFNLQSINLFTVLILLLYLII